MKRIVVSIICLAILSVSLLAAPETGYVVDEAYVLSVDEFTALEKTAGEIDSKYGVRLYVAFLSEYLAFGTTPEEACDFVFYDYLTSYEDVDAVMLMVGIGEREYYIAGYGDLGAKLLNDSARRTLEDAVLGKLSQNDWNGSAEDFIAAGKRLIADNAEGASEKSLLEKAPTAYGIALVVGLIAAFIVCGGYKAQMKSAVKATNAKQYVAAGNVVMHIREDRYINTTRTSRKIERSSDSDAKSGGGGKF